MQDLRKKEAFVYIIESPSDEDMLDGLTEGRSLASALELAEIRYCYNLVTTKNSLNIALTQRLFNAIAEENKLPILHFSMHGNHQGIGLTDKEFIQWHELLPFIVKIKTFLGNYSSDLLICMSSCYGSFANCMATMYPGNIPFKFLIGNKESVPWNDAAVAYITFYHLLFKGLHPYECKEIMCKASYNDKFELYDGEESHFNWISCNQNQIPITQIAREIAQTYIRQRTDR
ncbi:hypothetical protein VB713_20275 [Anabaena cylindrica UHCC 0172]|uniref:hypothetical protein n=1 Tax=Anabaena cylindrica TaxID=1165 RepID=UPI002B1F1DD6|nr:hypothetical protein [Anabaena cylindrica]MEA5553280.1 hypothetical protein [Anabaena cylindrica UHCC 0172]